MNSKDRNYMIKELKGTIPYWVNGNGPYNQIVISTRMRLARNLKGIPFPSKANDVQLNKVLDLSENMVEKNSHFKDYHMIKLEELSDDHVRFLVEKRLISIAQAKFNCPYRAFLYTSNEVISIMINEEDHYRIQCVLPGFQLAKVWKLIDNDDTAISEQLDYAFSEREGFLTSCPTNVGTGLRASVMLHLPALVILNEINGLMGSVSKKGYAIRGFYGEGTDFQGNYFQISNQSTLGFNENEIISGLNSLIRQVIEKEETAREKLMDLYKDKIEDQILRAYGVLTNARLISANEAIELLSRIRFGIELGLCIKASYDTINRLMLMIQPCYLQLIKGERMEQNKLDAARAELIQEIIR